MHCIVGLGNPGREYGRTRHNIGFWVIDALAERHGINVQRRRFRALFGKGRIAGYEALVLKPQIFMNNSGQAVDLVARFYRLAPSDLLVIYDDIALEPGITGLLPRSSMQRSVKPASLERLKQGDAIPVIIERIDPDERKITLAPGDPDAEEHWRGFAGDSGKSLGSLGERLQEALKSRKKR